MIIDNTYFQGELYIPEARPGVTSGVTDVESKIDDFIDDYTFDCLIKSLGSRLFYEFTAELDSGQANGLLPAADQKWDDLLNGMTYNNPSGDEVVWRGIRYESSLGSAVYNRSFLANYVYYYYESNDDVTRGGGGSFKTEAANAIRVAATQKTVKAWRKFLVQVQGTTFQDPYFFKEGRFGGSAVDFQRGNVDQEINLYQFINDQNELVPDTYANFNPKTWEGLTRLGI